jgi:hypothetical protein
MTTAEIKPHDRTGNVILQPKETASPWPIITPEARAGWNALQRELATGYVNDSGLLGRWYIDSWERTFQTTAPEWVTRTVPVIAPRETETPAPVAAAPEPGEPRHPMADVFHEIPDEDVSFPPEPAPEPKPDVPEPSAQDGEAGPAQGEAMTALLPPVEAPTALLPAVQDEEEQP